ncbi:hypothetical protein D3C71_1816640 [compost metagenome]
MGLELVFPIHLTDGAKLEVSVADHQQVARLHARDKNRHAGYGVVGLRVLYLKTVVDTALEHVAA